MGENIVNSPVPEENTPQRREFGVSECVFAWLCMLAGYLFCKSVPLRHNPLGGFILVVLLFVSASIVLKRRGAKIGALPLMAAISALIVSL